MTISLHNGNSNGTADEDLPAVLMKDPVTTQAILAIRQGNPRAFATLTQQYLGKVYNYVLRMVQNPSQAEDLTQDIFVRVYEKLDQFDIERPFQPWLMKIATNITLSALRKQQTETKTLTEIIHQEAAQGTSANYSSLNWAETHFPWTPQQIHQALGQLEPKYRQVLLLRCKYEYPYKDIADMMDTPVNTLKTWFHRGKDQLKSALETLSSSESPSAQVLVSLS